MAEPTEAMMNVHRDAHRSRFTGSAAAAAALTSAPFTGMTTVSLLLPSARWRRGPDGSDLASWVAWGALCGGRGDAGLRSREGRLRLTVTVSGTASERSVGPVTHTRVHIGCKTTYVYNYVYVYIYIDAG